MTFVDMLLARNQTFAAQQLAEDGLMPSFSQALPQVKAVIISCADMRVDPAHVLGIQPGEAVVLRNVGGRVTPGTLREMGLLGRISQVAEALPGGGEAFHLIVLHHTDCGITRLAGDPELLADYFEREPAALESRWISDPRKAVVADVDVLKATPGLPGTWLVSGLVYDVATGLINIVVPSVPLQQ